MKKKLMILAVVGALVGLAFPLANLVLGTPSGTALTQKAPAHSLRNIARTYPYFHDGTAADLAGAVKAMAQYQHGVTLSDAEVKQLTAFLQSLTGSYQGQTI